MLIVCPNCATSYHVEPCSLREGGKPARCGACGSLWSARNLSATVLRQRAKTPNKTAGRTRPPSSESATSAAPISRAAIASWTPSSSAPQPERSRAAGALLAIMLLVLINSVLIGWRAEVVKLLPQTASLYAAIGLPVDVLGLSFGDVASRNVSDDRGTALLVEGTIVSTSPRVLEVPRLRLSLRNRSGQEVHAWTARAAASVLPPGGTVQFRSRLASPPPEGHDVTVRFFNRGDLVAGLQ